MQLKPLPSSSPSVGGAEPPTPRPRAGGLRASEGRGFSSFIAPAPERPAASEKTSRNPRPSAPDAAPAGKKEAPNPVSSRVDALDKADPRRASAKDRPTTSDDGEALSSLEHLDASNEASASEAAQNLPVPVLPLPTPMPAPSEAALAAAGPVSEGNLPGALDAALAASGSAGVAGAALAQGDGAPATATLAAVAETGERQIAAPTAVGTLGEGRSRAKDAAGDDGATPTVDGADATGKSSASLPASAQPNTGTGGGNTNGPEAHKVTKPFEAIPAFAAPGDKDRASDRGGPDKVGDLGSGKPGLEAFAPASVFAHGGSAAAPLEHAVSARAADPAPANMPSVQQVPLAAVPVEIGAKMLAGTNRFEIRLDPEDLGRVEVRLDIDDAGGVKAQLVVDRVETLALLQRDAKTLERAFEQAGLRPSEGGIDLSLRNPHSDARGQDRGEGQPGRSDGHRARLQPDPEPSEAPAHIVRGLWASSQRLDLRI